MSQLPVFKYQIYCNTEDLWSIGYGTEPPTQCYYHSTDNVNPDSVQNLGLIGPNVVTAQDSSPENGIFQFSEIVIDIPPNTSAPNVIKVTKTYPYDMYIWQMSISQVPANLGDQLSLAIAPDTVIGYVTSTASAGTNTINVSDTVIANVVRGMDIGFTYTDGNSITTSEYTGIVASIDRVNKTITMTQNLINTYPGPAGQVPQAFVLLTLYPVKNITFDSAERLIVGAKGLKPKKIPAGTPVQIIYTDNTINNVNVKLYFQLEYYFV
jgi:archaellin